mmetsp:Transcript_124155/g.284590  ORF Transcript_124155/g.284590 Transcript_124155/m.284590 type:complete len:163 (-) Transcript_124155:116-604(-)
MAQVEKQCCLVPDRRGLSAFVGAMLPYFLIWPLWFSFAVALPVVNSLHWLLALSGPNSKEAQKQVHLWLFYWLLFTSFGLLNHYLGWIPDIIFGTLGYMVMDIQQEVYLGIAVALTNPMFPKLETLLGLVDSHSSEVLKKIHEVQTQASSKVTAAVKGAFSG